MRKQEITNSKKSHRCCRLVSAKLCLHRHVSSVKQKVIKLYQAGSATGSRITLDKFHLTWAR